MTGAVLSSTNTRPQQVVKLTPAYGLVARKLKLLIVAVPEPNIQSAERAMKISTSPACTLMLITPLAAAAPVLTRVAAPLRTMKKSKFGSVLLHA